MKIDQDSEIPSERRVIDECDLFNLVSVDNTKKNETSIKQYLKVTEYAKVVYELWNADV